MNNELPILFRIVWFFFIGVPVGSVMAFCAWVSCLTIVGLPLGLWLFDRLPYVMTLKEPTYDVRTIQQDGFYYLRKTGPEQLPLIIRLFWFVFFGSWLSAIWLSVAFALAASIIGAPFSFWMINRLPKVLWLTEV